MRGAPGSVCPSRRWVFLLSAAALLCAAPAHAILGERSDTVQADQLRFSGARSKRVLAQMTAHEISLPDGSSVREYVNAAGVVFAVSWRTRLKPDLANLLGPNFTVAAAGNRPEAGVAASRASRSARS